MGDFGDKGTANITEEYFDKLRPYLTEENYQKMLEKFKAIPRKKQEIS
ncbi:MAG: hypothetical protein WCG98_01805 [bacterium]